MIALEVLDAVLGVLVLANRLLAGNDKLRALFAQAAAEGRDLADEELLSLKEEGDLAWERLQRAYQAERERGAR